LIEPRYRPTERPFNGNAEMPSGLSHQSAVGVVSFHKTAVRQMSCCSERTYQVYVTRHESTNIPTSGNVILARMLQQRGSQSEEGLFKQVKSPIYLPPRLREHSQCGRRMSVARSAFVLRITAATVLVEKTYHSAVERLSLVTGFEEERNNGHTELKYRRELVAQVGMA